MPRYEYNEAEREGTIFADPASTSDQAKIDQEIREIVNARLARVADELESVEKQAALLAERADELRAHQSAYRQWIGQDALSRGRRLIEGLDAAVARQMGRQVSE